MVDDKFVKKQISILRKLLLLIPIVFIFYELKYFENITSVKVVIIIVIFFIPFLTDIIESKNNKLYRLTSLFALQIPSALIGILSAISIKGVENDYGTSIFTAVFGFGITVVIICFQFGDGGHKILATKHNKIYFSDFLLTMLINVMFTIYLNYSDNHNGVLILTVLTGLQIYITLHYYIKVIMEER